jgi:hypothetical protein
LQIFLKLKHRLLNYKLFFVKFYWPPSHLHHHASKLHPISMDWERPLHNVGWLLISSTSSKIDFLSHLQGLVVIQMVDLIMWKHVIPMFSWKVVPSPCKVVCHWKPLMPLKPIPSCAQNWHKYPKTHYLDVNSNNFSLGGWLMKMGAM